MDFYFIAASEPDLAVTRLIELVKERIPHRFGFDPMRDIQVLCPMNRGGLDARSLNIELQRALNPHGEPKVEKFGTTFSIGDKVMQIENDYDKGAVCKIKYKLLHFMLRRQHARQAANAEHLRQDQRAGGHDRFNLKRSSRGARLLHRAPGISPSCGQTRP